MASVMIFAQVIVLDESLFTLIVKVFRDYGNRE